MSIEIKCDRCKRILSNTANNIAILTVDTFSKRGVISVHENYDIIRKKDQKIQMDLCNDCLNDLCAFLKMEDPKFYLVEEGKEND